MRSTGLDILGKVRWGTHFCQFYEDQRDLVDVLVPYFKAGLEHNEYCMWITSEPLRVEEAKAAMRAAVPGFEAYLEKGQIKVLDYGEWYLAGGRFDAQRVLDAWVSELHAARARGLEGLRLTGNTFWLEQATWRDFTDYEAAVDRVIGQYPMLAMCTYSLAKCGAAEIMDVMSNHAFAIIKRNGHWQVIESAERRKIETSLRLSEERYRSLFNSMTEGFALHEIVCDAKGAPCDYRFLDINPAFERMTGLTRAETVGRLMSEVLPQEDPVWVANYGRVALTGEPVHFDHYAPELKRHYDVFAYRPAPGQFAVVFLDVSELKRAEQRLAEANRLKDEFLANLSHELRTPLNAILGWADLLSRQSLDAATTRRGLDAISRNARAQASLVSDVLDVSRIIAGQMRLNVGPVDLGVVVRNAIDVLRPAADAKRIAIASSILGSGTIVTADAERLQQVLWNLLSNAVKFTPHGGHVSVRLRRLQSQLEVAVQDDGIGIGPAFLPFVFDRFRQEDASSSRKHAGLGLGLAITRHLVELHGGTVQASSEGEGRGSTFVVRLPVRAIAGEPPRELRRSAGTEARAESDARRLPPGVLHALDILVVDDEEDARELIAMVLEQQGAKVRAAASAADALSLLAERVPDILVADVGMPVTDGYELVRRVRADPRPAVAKLPAVACTAYGRDEDRMRALRAGFQQHLSKPVAPDELVAVIAATAGRPIVGG